ncbi:MAG: hypothetical protein M0005_04860 [Actinomycetota bacterium]|nr:hypothetical protein [Actinomycetota bacterium]
MPPNYRQQQGAPLSGRERRGFAVLAGVVVAAGVGLGTWGLAAGGGPSTAQGKCVSVLVASSTGGGELRHCGKGARNWCTTQASTAGTVAAEATAACRREGFLPNH